MTRQAKIRRDIRFFMKYWNVSRAFARYLAERRN